MQEHKLHSPKNRKILKHTQVSGDSSFSPVRLDRMHSAMQRYIYSGWASGIVTLVHHRGHEHVDAIGTMAFNSDVPMQRDTIFRLASMTKPITAVATMMLVEECRLRLDDPVDEWLPELKDRKVLRTIDSQLDDTIPSNRPITLRDLLTFRSGYGEVAFTSPTCPLQKAMTEARLPLTEWIFPGTPDEFMKRLGNLPLASQPGERWLYHMSAEILGVLISRVSGQSLGQFLCERIFEPLGMKDTGFFVPEAKIDRLPTCYGTDLFTKELVVLDEARGGQVAQPPLFEAGAGGLVSTVDDMAAFGLMMVHKGTYNGERILSRPSIELMTMDHLTAEQKAASPFFENFWDTRGWGLGLGVTTKNTDLGEVTGRFGWDGAFGTSWYVDPKEQLVGVLMIQRRPDFLKLPAITHDFWASAYQLIDN
ncbi:beta-lactamase family protein [Ginsengibacter hankyongi]|uniref:Beta-lactamase family protein n=1 Tax=Ginsengibacter hankyongi TaxID=2607284 RepID=A0A5J5IHB7_9BACT|nr:serine hydrolase domain-containing protein [Ginsengibacter hankyongi]KAA9037132.1 beta-lactamase family protein [Ginsengibacter hankyongi]